MTFEEWWEKNEAQYSADACHMSEYHMASVVWDAADLAPEWQRMSAINGVEFHKANPTAGPDHSHIEWLKEKEATGWKFGPVKNPETKEHPCFVPYEQLPVEQKAKDYLFRAVVHALA